MRTIGIGKRPWESSNVGVESLEIVEKVEKLVKKVDNLEYVVGLIYNTLKAKDLGVGIKVKEIPTCPVEAGEECREEV